MSLLLWGGPPVWREALPGDGAQRESTFLAALASTFSTRAGGVESGGWGSEGY